MIDHDWSVGPCNDCSRRGKLRLERAMPPNPLAGITAPWTFRHYRCRWHQAAETRRQRRLAPPQQDHTTHA